MENLKDTTKLQIASLNGYANALGYSYVGKWFENDRNNKVGFSRMVELHNNKYFKRCYSFTRQDRFVTIGEEALPTGVFVDAKKNALVEQVFLQQKRDGMIVCHKHLIKLHV